MYTMEFMKKIKNKTAEKTVARKIFIHSGKISSMILKIILVMGMTTFETLTSRPTYNYKTINYKELWNEPFFGYPKVNPKIIKPRSISAALQRLQKQGLVIHENGKWIFTKAGKNFAESAFKYKKFRNKNLLPKKDGVKRIMIFDVPETEKEKRDWLRGELVHHDYEPLQKSVWIGNRPLLPEFIKTIDFLGMSSYIHIFSIKDEGTIFS